MKCILCVYTCDREPYISYRERLVRSAWMQDALRDPQISVFFVRADPTLTEPQLRGQDLTLPCDERYDALAQKTLAMFRYFCAHCEFDYLLKIDDSIVADPEYRRFDRRSVSAYCRGTYGGYLPVILMPGGVRRWYAKKGLDLDEEAYPFWSALYGGKLYVLNRPAAIAVSAHGAAYIDRVARSCANVEDVMVSAIVRTYVLSFREKSVLYLRGACGSLGVNWRAAKRKIYDRLKQALTLRKLAAFPLVCITNVIGSLHRVTFPPRQRQHCDSLAIIFIGSGKYVNFFPRYYESSMKLFLPDTPKHYYVFTDHTDAASFSGKENVTVIAIPHLPWPQITLRRYAYIASIADRLQRHSHVIFLDADTFVARRVVEAEFFVSERPLFAVRHPAFLHSEGTFERNPASLACVGEADDLSVYVMGGMWGGTTPGILKMSRELDRRIEADRSRGVTAIWHDESHLNKYFIEHRQAFFVHTPSYMYPEGWYLPCERKIVHIEKDHAAIRATE